MFRKSNLRKLIDSISKHDFEIFKHAVEKKTEEGEVVKKLYEKWTGRPIPEDRLYLVGIEFGDRNLYRTDDHTDEYISVKIMEGTIDENNHTRRVNTDAIVQVDDDILNAIKRYTNHIEYRNYSNVKDGPIVSEYIEVKALHYDVELDNETFHKLRNLVESL